MHDFLRQIEGFDCDIDRAWSCRCLFVDVCYFGPRTGFFRRRRFAPTAWRRQRIYAEYAPV